MADSKKRLSELPSATTTEGLYTLGVNDNNEGMKIPCSLFDKNIENKLKKSLSGAIADTEEIKGTYKDGVWRLGLTEAAKRQAVIDEWMARCTRLRGSGSSVVLGGYDKEDDIFYLGDHEATLTFEEVKLALIMTPATCGIPNGTLAGFRTQMAPVYFSPVESVSMNREFRYGTMRAVALAGYNKVLTILSAIMTFSHCSALKTIIGEIALAATSPSQTVDMFGGCTALETVKIKSLQTDLSFGDSPNLSLASLQHLVANAANTAVITVTVHPTVYEKLSDETNTEWHTVLTDALAKNISIASA